MAMKVANFNDCKVYNLSSGKTMPQWLSESKKRALLKDDEYRKRLELIQDFEMSVASQCIKMTPDGEHIIVTGTYPPVVRCYTLSDLSLKFQRGLSCEVVAFETLSQDFGKLVFLQRDRYLNFHAPYGTHYNIRVPKFGRDLTYNWNNCDLYVAGSGDEVYRLNLEHGQFKEPFHLGFEGCNKLHINPVHNLLGCGGENASCEFFDPRTRKSVSSLIVADSTSVSVTALKFDTDGLTLGVGTSNGNCILYDIRSNKPLYTKEHQYGLPIIDINFHNASRHVISTDKKIVKIWEREEATRGKILTNIETPADINNILVVEDKKGSSGLLMMAGEQTRVMTYFVPNLGHAPRWCSFLESLTEELEENASQNVYEDYKFITHKEVDELGATALVGTPLLRGYMHGFFIEMKLYNRLRAVSKPFEYEEYRLQKIKQKIEEKRQSRITPRKRLPKVNKELAKKLIGKDGDPDSMVDDRFAELFKREEFQQDETSDEFKLRKPTVSGRKPRGDDDDDDDENYNLHRDDPADVEEKNDDNDEYEDIDDNCGDEGDDDGNSILDEDENEERYVRGKSGKKTKSSGKKNKFEDSNDEGQIMRATKRRMQSKSTSLPSSIGRDQKSRSKGPTMYEVSSGVSASKAMFSHAHRQPPRGHSSDNRSLPLHARLPKSDALTAGGAHRGGQFSSKHAASLGDDKSTRKSHSKSHHSEKDGYIREISFLPKSDSKPVRRGGRNSSSKDDRGNKKGSRTDRERSHFSN